MFKTPLAEILVAIHTIVGCGILSLLSLIIAIVGFLCHNFSPFSSPFHILALIELLFFF